MKVATKLTLGLVLGILAVMGAYAYVQVRREVSFFESDLQQLKRRGHALRATVRSVWQREGEERTREIVAEMAAMLGETVEAHWRRLDAPHGDARYTDLTADERAALARDGAVRHTRTAETGEVSRNTYLLMAPGDPTVLEVSESLQREVQFVQMSELAIAGATFTVALVCGLIAVGIGYRFVGRPIRELRDQSRLMAAGDFSHRLVVRQRDEIGELAHEMNALADRLVDAREQLAAETEARIATLEQLRHTDRLATVGQLASGIAHELGTPLSIVSARAVMLGADQPSPAEVSENARIIGEQAGRMTGIIRQLLDFSRRRGPQLGIADVRVIAARTLELLSSAARKRRVSTALVGEPSSALAEVDQNQLQQALANVIVNGIQSMPEGGRLTVEVSPRRVRPPDDSGRPEGDYLCVTVQDEGCGIAPDHVGRIFEPFFTTKEHGKGTGLGLSTVYGIINNHGGTIEVESEPNRGTTFSLYFPLIVSSPQAGAVALDKASLVRGNNETILVVEDEVMLLDLASSILQSHGYRVLRAENGLDAVRMYQTYAGEVSVVLSDMGLPGLGGMQAFEQMKMVNPNVVAVFATGYLDDVAKESLAQAGVVGFLQKPYLPNEILAAVHNAVQVARTHTINE